jgi:hypothetical protein
MKETPMTAPKQIPTVGRKVWLTLTELPSNVAQRDPAQPFDASVAFVTENPDLLNLSFFDHNGSVHSIQNVPLRGSAESKTHWDWMPYQQRQHEKHHEEDSRVDSTKKADELARAAMPSYQKPEGAGDNHPHEPAKAAGKPGAASSAVQGARDTKHKEK